MENEDAINEKESKFRKFKRLFMENGCIRLSVYNTVMLLVFIIPMPVLLAYAIIILMCRIEYRAQLASYTDERDCLGFPVQKIGELDQKVQDFVKKSFKKLIKKEYKKTVDEEIKMVDNRETIEKLNNQLKELNPYGSIVRDPKEIALEKEKYMGLLELLEYYQAQDNKDKQINNTPVPTIEFDNNNDKGYSYMKK